MNNYAPMHPIIYAIKEIINKFRQNPDVYPIKHYKKLNRNRRKRADMYK